MGDVIPIILVRRVRFLGRVTISRVGNGETMIRLGIMDATKILQDSAPLNTTSGFPGMYCDKETQTCQNWHRDYVPALGSYWQSDHIGLYGGMNTYEYAAGDPLGKSDPTGESPSAALRAALAAMIACRASKACRCAVLHSGYSVLCRMKQCGSATTCAEALVATSATMGCLTLRGMFLGMGCSSGSTKKSQLDELEKRRKSIAKCEADVSRLCKCNL